MKKIIATIIAIVMTFAPIATPPAHAAWTRPAGFSTMASQAGWTLSEQRVLNCVISRESGWNRYAWNRNDPGYGSFGWLQLNMSKGVYGTWAFYRERLGYNIFSLWNPSVNLKIGKDLSVRSARMYGDKWRPWRPLGRCA